MFVTLVKKPHSFVASDVSSLPFHSVSFSLLLLSHHVIACLVVFSVSHLAKTLIRPPYQSPTLGL